MGILNEMRLKLRREIKDALLKNPEEDELLGERRESPLKGSRYGGMTNPQHLKRIAEVLEAYDSLDSTAEIVPSWAKENYKDLRKFKAMYKRYGADKALGFLAKINPELRQIIERDLRHDKNIRAGGLHTPMEQ